MPENSNDAKRKNFLQEEVENFTLAKLNPFARIQPKSKETRQSFWARLKETQAVLAGSAAKIETILEQDNVSLKWVRKEEVITPANQGVLSLPWYLFYHSIPMLGIVVLTSGAFAMASATEMLNSIGRRLEAKPILKWIASGLASLILGPMAVIGITALITGLIAYGAGMLTQGVLWPLDRLLQNLVIPAIAWLVTLLVLSPIVGTVHKIIGPPKNDESQQNENSDSTHKYLNGTLPQNDNSFSELQSDDSKCTVTEIPDDNVESAIKNFSDANDRLAQVAKRWAEKRSDSPLTGRGSSAFHAKADGDTMKVITPIATSNTPGLTCTLEKLD